MARERRPSGFRLGTVRGIQLAADWSLVLIFILIATSLAMGMLHARHPDWGAGLRWGVAFAAALLFFGSILLHELSHALVGRRFGVPVRRITLFVFGGLAHVEREPPSPKAEFWMAIAGPLVSLAIGLLSLAVGGALAYPAYAQSPAEPARVLRALDPLTTLLLWLGPVNLLLALFNMVPGFPLDGGRVLRALLWRVTGDLRRATRWASGLGQGFAWGLMGLGAAMLFGYQVPLLGGGGLSGVWLILIGWFLNNAARTSFEQLLMRQALEDVPVRDVMRARVATVSPHETVGTLVRDYIMNTDQRAFPVVMDDVLLGLLQIDDLREVPRERWDEVMVSEVMVPADRLKLASPDDDAAEVLQKLAERDPIPVVEEGHLVGVARRDDLVKWIALRVPSHG